MTVTVLPTPSTVVHLHPSPAADPDGHTDPAEVRPPDRVAVLFAELRGAPTVAGRQAAREELVQLHLPFAEFLARRFRNRGEPIEDLHQVAAIGLIKAIDGFDPDRGTAFPSYAIPTVLGELRRHFRDKGWNVRVPRRLQELRAEIIAVREPLTQELRRPPTRAEIAEALGLTTAEVEDALLAAQAYSATSLQTPAHRDETGDTVADLVAHEDDGYEMVEARESLRVVLGSLPERERRILGLRFYRQLTQCEIAAELGISQMHVSRLITRSLGDLRERLQPTG